MKRGMEQLVLSACVLHLFPSGEASGKLGASTAPATAPPAAGGTWLRAVVSAQHAGSRGAPARGPRPTTAAAAIPRAAAAAVERVVGERRHRQRRRERLVGASRALLRVGVGARRARARSTCAAGRRRARRRRRHARQRRTGAPKTGRESSRTLRSRCPGSTKSDARRRSVYPAARSNACLRHAAHRQHVQHRARRRAALGAEDGVEERPLKVLRMREHLCRRAARVGAGAPRHDRARGAHRVVTHARLVVVV